MLRPRSFRFAARLRTLTALAGLLATSGCGENLLGPTGPSLPDARGVTVADWTAGGYASPGCFLALEDIEATGANVVALVVTRYQPDRTSSVIRALPRTPSPSAVETAARAARARGLQVTLKSHVDVEDGTWRALIDPEDPDAWFAAYRNFVLPWAEFAESIGSAQFVLGTELAGTLRHEERWRSLIAEVRRVFSGDLIYSASWDEVTIVPFWDALDLIGVNAYFPVATRPDATRFDLLAGWRHWLARLDLLRRRTGRPIVFTEIGYRSVDGAGMNPSDFTSDAAVDLQEQADLYWAALEATHSEPWFAGMYWWNWLVDGSGGEANRDYTPSGKPASGELAAFWSS